MKIVDRERSLNADRLARLGDLARVQDAIANAAADDDAGLLKSAGKDLARVRSELDVLEHALRGIRQRRVAEMKAAQQNRIDELRSQAEAKRADAARIRSKSREALQRFYDLEAREAAPGAMLILNENFDLAALELALRAQFPLKSVRLETEASHLQVRADGMNVEEIRMENTTDASNLEEILAAIYDPNILGPRETEVVAWYEAMMGELKRRGQHGHQLRWRVAWAKGELDMNQSSCEIIIPARADLNLRSSVRILRFNGTEFSDNQHVFGWSADRVWDVAEVRTVA